MKPLKFNTTKAQRDQVIMDYYAASDSLEALPHARFTIDVIEDLDTFRAILKELCELKTIKDTVGPTSAYERRKSLIWDMAFSCFPEYKAPGNLDCENQNNKKDI